MTPVKQGATRGGCFQWVSGRGLTSVLFPNSCMHTEAKRRARYGGGRDVTDHVTSHLAFYERRCWLVLRVCIQAPASTHGPQALNPRESYSMNCITIPFDEIIKGAIEINYRLL